jgi:site-specific DNA recombinase
LEAYGFLYLFRLSSLSSSENLSENLDYYNLSKIELGPRWLEEVLAIISLKDEIERVKTERQQVQEKLRHMTKVYIDGLFPDDEYHRQKRLLEMALESLVVPEASAAEEAGRLIQKLSALWKEANQEERRKLLLTMLDAVYVDAKKTRPIVTIKPKPPFIPVFQVAVLKEGSSIQLYKQTHPLPRVDMGRVSGGGEGGSNSPSRKKLPAPLQA